MRIHVLSDLHMEHGEWETTAPECDVVILSGDIHTGVKAVEWARKTFPDHPVVFTPGNHELWGGVSQFRTLDEMRAAAEGTNVHFLYNDKVEIDGVRFLGATLWTDFELYRNAPLSMMIAQGKLNDFSNDPSTARIMRTGTMPFSAHHALGEHRQTMAFLHAELRTPYGEKGLEKYPGKTVVVTHHAPSERSIHEHYAGDLGNPAYASGLDNMIGWHDIDLWTHGHMHNSSDYEINGTRVICNPKGHGEGVRSNATFDPKLVVTI